MLNQTGTSTWDAWKDIFWVFWAFLDMVFTGITNMFVGIFNEMPRPAIPIIVALACYALVDFVRFVAESQDGRLRSTIMRSMSVVTSLVAFFFGLWRIGLVEAMDGALTFEALSEVMISLIYIAFAIAIAYAFMAANGDILRKGLQAILWSSLFLMVFVFAPVFDGFEPTFNTLSQLIVGVLIFGSPKLLNQYQKSRKEGEDEETK